MDSSLLASAQTPVTTFIYKLNAVVVNPIIVVMFACALFLFIWGVRGYISGADNEEVRQKGANQIMWGIIGMAIMLMTFSIIKIVLNTFGITAGTTPESQQTKEAIEKIIR